MKIAGQAYRSIWATSDHEVNIIDQTCLPHAFQVCKITSLESMIVAIKTMQVRGAPLIGAAAAYGIALAASKSTTDANLRQAANMLIESRPTAVNLRWAVERVMALLRDMPESIRHQAAWDQAALICDEDVALNQAIGQQGLQLLSQMQAQKTTNTPLQVLTHCNAGWLATVDGGTALAPIYAAHDAGLPIHVWVDETRPRNQGASLTAWELAQHGVPHTVICDNAGGHYMQHGKVDCVIVGADRVTSQGDVCNKIGTYLKALAAYDNDIPFYAAVPFPTIDWNLRDGIAEIPIEERNAEEVACMTGMNEEGHVQSIRLLASGSPVANPAFDVTPARLVTGIMTERGVFRPQDLLSAYQE